MRELNDDDKLRELFADVRAEVKARERAPDFRTMIERARADAARIRPLGVVHGGLRGEGTRTSRSRRLAWAGGSASALVAAGVAALLLAGRDVAPDREFDQLVAGFTSDVSAGAWKSPTAGLLQVPGLELLREVPNVGGSVREAIPDERFENIAPEAREG